MNNIRAGAYPGKCGGVIMMGSKKGLGAMGQIALVFVALLAVGGMMFGAFMWYNQGTAQPGDAVGDEPGEEPGDVTEARWADQAVKKNIKVQELSNDYITSGTIYLYKEKPDGWQDDQAFSGEDEFNKYTISSEETTVQELPVGDGGYYAVVTNSNDYNAYFRLELPDGSDKPSSTSLSDYNSAPAQQTVDIHDRYSLGSSAFDFGDLSNDSTEQDLRARQYYTPDKDTEYRLERVVIMNGDQDGSSPADNPTEDADNDGIYDAGVSEATVEVSGAVNTGAKSVTFFNPGNGVDKLGSENTADMTFGTAPEGMTFDNDNTMTVTIENTVAETEDGTSVSADDEVLSDGENIWDIQFFDVAGNGNTVADVSG